MARPIIEYTDFSLPEGQRHVKREMNDEELAAYTARCEAEDIKQAELATTEYKRKREAELAPLDGDGMDAIRKEIADIRAGQPESPEYADYRQKVQAIKDKHPKPEGE